MSPSPLSRRLRARFAAFRASVVVALAGATAAVAATPAINVAGFDDSRHHWRNIIQPERFMQATGPDQPSHAPEQVREIAANILLFQRDNGGWPKDYDMRAVLTEEQKQQVRATRANTDTSYDNHTTHTQVAYLARAYVVTRDAALRDACRRGLEFILSSQYPNGGFPQWWPRLGAISKRITLNDGVMMGIMNVLKDAGGRAPHFAWLDEPLSVRCAQGEQRGLECLLKMQVTANGVRTGWGQQHDEKTLATVGARTFELPCIAPGDTVEVVRFLMRYDRPSEEIVAAVEAAVAWLQKTQLNGITVKRVPAPPAEFVRHKTDFDVVVVPDTKAPPLWARMVEPGTDRPIFASRDGIKVYSLAEVDRERRTGSGWYVPAPRRLLENDYPAWRAKQGK
jgi:PelA/Pel-15E family pectate lyase